MSELDPKHRPLAPPPGGDQTAPPLGSHPGGRGPEHGLRERTGAGSDHPRDTRPDRATRYLETTRGILSYAELAPLLAERVTLAEAALYREVLARQPLDEFLILNLHRQICGDLVPVWAGRWRNIEVQVGQLRPPPPHEVAEHMRNYFADLAARWPAAAGPVSDLTLEFLAYAEGRFLTVHPFCDFNGRTIRLFLLELLRRLDLPCVILAPEAPNEKAIYFTALEAADRHDLTYLMEVWRARFSHPALET